MFRSSEKKANASHHQSSVDDGSSSSSRVADLPHGWDIATDLDGKVYFIDHNSRNTTWLDPRAKASSDQRMRSLGHSLDESSSVNDRSKVRYAQRSELHCEKPTTTTASNTQQCQPNFHNHRPLTNMSLHYQSPSLVIEPNEEWRVLQEEMLRQYLANAEADLNAKKELIDIKQQRLSLAQEEYVHLNNTLANLSTSETSLNSACSSASSKYDPDLLKLDVQHARARVERIKIELANIDTEVAYKQRGVETLTQVCEQFSDDRQNISLEEAQAIRAELQNIQRSLSNGVQERNELMKSLACLKDDLTRLQSSESSLDVSLLNNPFEKFSMACQTDFSGEIMPIGARLAEMARIRMQYDEARRIVQDTKQALANLEEKMSPGQLESDKDRLLLIQDKEQLLRELRSISPRTKTRPEMLEVQQKITLLERDLNRAMEDSNRCIADRLRIHEEKQLLLQQLTDGIRTLSKLEAQLKSLSSVTSTMSISSSSSLGSLSSSHASSKGSLSSLSFTDIYGLSTTQGMDSSMLDLQRKVDRILNRTQTETGSQQQNNNSTQDCYQTPFFEKINGNTSSSDSLSPSSPEAKLLAKEKPIMNFSNGALAEKQRRIHQTLAEAKEITDQISELSLSKDRSLQKLSTIIERDHPESCEESHLRPISRLQLPTTTEESITQSPHSPVSDSTGVAISIGSSTAAVSDESVAGDSGVYEARSKTNLGHLSSSETAQVQIKLRYSKEDSHLYVGIEQAKNLSALFIPENKKICVKASLLPSDTSSAHFIDSPCTFCTRFISLHEKSVFGETFPVYVPIEKLAMKTLQVMIWSEDECLGSCQLALADFNAAITSVKWCKVLSFHFMLRSKEEEKMQKKSKKHLIGGSKHSTLKEESSDESTIISSQTSTLTRNVGPDALNPHFSKAEGRTEPDLEMSDNDYDEDCKTDDDGNDDFVIPSLSETMNSLSSLAASSCLTEAKSSKPTSDKQTNTECVFLPPSVHKQKSLNPSSKNSSVKRSQTFSQGALLSKEDYSCKLNRSDSDSAMSKQKKMAFQRTLERRSLCVPRNYSASSCKNAIGASKSEILQKNLHKKVPSIQTPLDLCLDLAAQKSKLDLLQEEIDRLRKIKSKLEQAKSKGTNKLPQWFTEHEVFQEMLEKTDSSPDESGQSKEDRRTEKLLKKTGKEIYKLRKTKMASKGQPDLQAFKEKLAFFTSLKSEVPVLGDEDPVEGMKGNVDETIEEISQRIVEDENEDMEVKQKKTSASSETVNTLTDQNESACSPSSSDTTSKRFSYEIDPDIGVIV